MPERACRKSDGDRGSGFAGASNASRIARAAGSHCVPSKLPTAERHMLHDRARRDLGGDVAAEMYGDDEFIKMCKTYALHLLDRRRAS